MKIILDASAALEVILCRKNAENLRRYLIDSEKVISSDLYKAETANALWKYVRADLLNNNQANQLLGLAL